VTQYISIIFPTDSTNPDNIQSIDSLLLDLSTLRSATENFAESNKLGEGGFGAVYKVQIISNSGFFYFNKVLNLLVCASHDA
jgi:hypothetical protein